MKAKTMRMTKICKVCGCAFTYRSEEKMQKGNRTGHICNACKKMLARK